MRLLTIVALLALLVSLPGESSRAESAHERSPDALPTTDRAPYVPPLDVVDVVRGFAPPTERWGAGHRGVDLATTVGQAVLAPGPGTVTFTGMVAGRGVVTVAHPEGLRSSLEPVTASVEVGDRVSAGAVVGEVAATAGHCAPSACLHWGVRDGDAYLNPLRLLRAGPSVLLPGP